MLSKTKRKKQVKLNRSKSFLTSFYSLTNCCNQRTREEKCKKRRLRIIKKVTTKHRLPRLPANIEGYVRQRTPYRPMWADLEMENKLYCGNWRRGEGKKKENTRKRIIKLFHFLFQRNPLNETIKVYLINLQLWCFHAALLWNSTKKRTL